MVFRQIRGYLEPRLIPADYASGIFSHIYNLIYIEAYLPTFGYDSADSSMFRILLQLDILLYIYIVYPEPMVYSGVFGSVDIFGRFQPLLKSHSCVF